MSDIPERSAVIAGLRDTFTGVARFEVRPVDLEDARRRYAEEGFDFSPRLREFLEIYGEITVNWEWRERRQEFTTSVERTLDAPHGTPRNMNIYAKRIGRPVLPVGMVFSTEECVLLADNDDILFAGDAGIQRVANGFEDAVRALVTADWDKTFF
ncbi:SUKH-3 domain-containing protein [Streptomyces sp. NPDC019531]|uniref:SUKH-3 domain-containing protein n=1 Tax=Streptomyces sp. NPDC019531 TaxID=3365062 RepID=UPI0038511FA7